MPCIHRPTAIRSRISVAPRVAAPLTSPIVWIPAEPESLPDTETTVLVACSIRMSDPVWRAVDIEEIEVTHWANLPDPPNS